jgi:glutamate mutase epsilon subunit
VTIKTTVGKCIFNNALPEDLQFTILEKVDLNKQFKKNEIKIVMDKVYDIGGQDLLADVANKLKDL